MKKLLLIFIFVSGPVFAVIPPGDYTIVINPTPCLFFSGTDCLAGDWGSDGAWNSSFTFGGNLPGTLGVFPNFMTDTAAQIDTPSGKRGSGIGGDGYTGVIGINVTNDPVTGNSNFTVTSFSKDAIFNTAGGTFVQYSPNDKTGPNGTLPGSIGSIKPINCEMVFTPTSRLGGIGGFFPVAGALHDERWNIDSFLQGVAGTKWTNLTTLTHTIPIPNGNRATGRPLRKHPANTPPLPGTVESDANGDGRVDFTAILVTGGGVGADWGGFFNALFFEFWNVDILSVPGQVPNLGPVNICTGLAIDPPPSVIPEPLNSRDTFHPGSIAGCSLSKGQGGMEWFLILGFLVLLRYKYSQQTKYDH